MKKLDLLIMIGASLSLPACGQDAGVGEEEMQTSENAVAGEPGELGTAEGSFDVAGERPVNAEDGAQAQNSVEGR